MELLNAHSEIRGREVRIFVFVSSVPGFYVGVSFPPPPFFLFPFFWGDPTKNNVVLLVVSFYSPTKRGAHKNDNNKQTHMLKKTQTCSNDYIVDSLDN